VATDWLGASGRAILSRMLDGEKDAGKLADGCVTKSLKWSLPCKDG